MTYDDFKNVPSAADAFAVSYEIQELASKQGFDWPEVSGVLEKVKEELGEVAQRLERLGESPGGVELPDLADGIRGSAAGEWNGEEEDQRRDPRQAI